MFMWLDLLGSVLLQVTNDSFYKPSKDLRLKCFHHEKTKHWNMAKTTFWMRKPTHDNGNKCVQILF